MRRLVISYAIAFQMLYDTLNLRRLLPLFCVRNYLELDPFVGFDELNATTTLFIHEGFREKVLKDEVILCVGKVCDGVMRAIGFNK